MTIKQTLPHIKFGLLAVALLSLVAACTPVDALHRLALERGAITGQIEEGGFTLTTLASPELSAQIPLQQLRVYLGGDGLPWQGDHPADDPTGTSALAAQLMMRDPTPGVYLGRPCYHALALSAVCNESLWTDARYSARVVSVMVAAITQLVDQYRPKKLTLIGYSGGGVIALLAAELLANELPLTVVTVAANLDTDAWVAYHGVLPLSGSLNPVTAVSMPGGFLQVHLLGQLDPVVPPATIEAYQAAHPDASYLYVDDFDHSCCWLDHWPAILERVGGTLSGQ